MKKLIFTIVSLATSIFAATPEGEFGCNLDGVSNGNPSGSCSQIGYICNLGFGLNGDDNMMFFNLGADSTCSESVLGKSRFTKKRGYDDDSKNPYAKFFLTENEDHIGPLSMTLASSLAMLAVNNNYRVYIIYKENPNAKVEFDGVKLLSIALVNTVNP